MDPDPKEPAPEESAAAPAAGAADASAGAPPLRSQNIADGILTCGCTGFAALFATAVWLPLEWFGRPDIGRLLGLVLFFAAVGAALGGVITKRIKAGLYPTWGAVIIRRLLAAALIGSAMAPLLLWAEVGLNQGEAVGAGALTGLIFCWGPLSKDRIKEPPPPAPRPHG